MAASHNLAIVQTPTDPEVDRALWDCYKYLIALGRRRTERLARQAAEAGQGDGQPGGNGEGVRDAKP